MTEGYGEQKEPNKEGVAFVAAVRRCQSSGHVAIAKCLFS